MNEQSRESNPIRAVIVEDEPMARQTLRDFLGEVTWIDLAGEATSGLAAVRLLRELRPDLVFLDVQMPELTGLQILEELDFEPAVIFTTAHDAYAVQAFELGAIDYLLKPFGRQRFAMTISRLRERMTVARGSDPVPVRERAVASAFEPLTRLFVRHRGRILPVRIEEISWLEAGDDYVSVYVGGACHLVGLTLGEFERRLPSDLFRRVHRSHIVNLDYVESIEPYDRRLALRLRDGTTVVASRSASQTLRDLIG